MSAKYYAPLDLKKLSNVPAQLRELPVWLLWKEGRPNGKDKPKKIPYYTNAKARSGVLDTPEDRAHLVTLDVVVGHFDPTSYAGIGVALGPVSDSSVILSGIDLDQCVKEDGEVASTAQKIIEAGSGAYTEISPSRNGVKLFGLGDIGKLNSDALEIYSAGRYFTITGDRIAGDRLTDLTEAAALARTLLAKLCDQDEGKKPIKAGSRNATLFSFACSLTARGIADADAWELLQGRNVDCDPRLDVSELKQIHKSARRYNPNFRLTDLGNAERLIALHGDDMRYIKGSGWATWGSHRWELRHAEDRVMRLMADTARGMYAEAAKIEDQDHRRRLAQHAQASEARNRLDAAVAIARWRGESASAEEYDADPLLLSLANGIYDLKRDEFRAGRRDDQITLQAAVAYDPHATAPRWEQFQREIHPGDEALVTFKQRAWGYTLTADASEQGFFIMYGDGSNGKGTELRVIHQLLGAYSKKVEPQTLMARRDSNSPSNDIARLRGARFVQTSETEDGKHLAENLIKQLTGQDRMTARFMYKEFFEFDPTFKIWLATNFKPVIRATNYAMWRRVNLIPYTAQFKGETKDRGLEGKLLTELPGILNWMIEGFRLWRPRGLDAPESVVAATAAYRESMDQVGNFLKECCKVLGLNEHGKTRSSVLYRVYDGWCKDGEMHPLSRPRFYGQLEQTHGLRRVDGDDGKLCDVPGVVLITKAYGREYLDA